MRHLRHRIEALAERGKNLSPNGHLRVEVCLGGNLHSPFNQRLNQALLAADEKEQHEIFRDIIGLWHRIQSESRDSNVRRQAEQLLGPTLASCCCGRIEPTVVTITADRCQVQVWHGIPFDIGPDTVTAIERPIFSVKHTYHVNTIEEYVRTIQSVMTKPVSRKDSTGFEPVLEYQEIPLKNGTTIWLPIRTSELQIG